MPNASLPPSKTLTKILGAPRQLEHMTEDLVGASRHYDRDFSPLTSHTIRLQKLLLANTSVEERAAKSPWEAPKYLILDENPFGPFWVEEGTV